MMMVPMLPHQLLNVPLVGPALHMELLGEGPEQGVMLVGVSGGGEQGQLGLARRRVRFQQGEDLYMHRRNKRFNALIVIKPTQSGKNRI